MGGEKSKIEAFLPVMKEIEAAGHNPVKIMFANECVTIEIVEIVSRALAVCKKKYPQWYSVMGEACAL